MRMDEAFIGARGSPVSHVDMWMRQLQRAAAARGLSAQAMDAEAVCGRVHLESALLHARRAFERGNNLARTLWVEWVLCAAGVRQVDVAFQRVGISDGTTEFAILLLSDEGELEGAIIGDLMNELGLEHDDDVMKCNEASLRRLGVSDGELEATPRERWQDLALERVALLDLER
jgi:KEOPS complex subunit Cgi121